MSDTPTGTATPSTVLEYEGLQVVDRPAPRWWKWIFIATIAFAPLYLIYYHGGAPGRTLEERYSAAMAENMRRQFAEIGDLEANEETILRYMEEPQWLRVGQSVFAMHCASCHSADGGGQIGPNLTDDYYKHVESVTDIARVVRSGAAGGAMPAWQDRLHPNEVVLVSSYVASLRGTTPANPRAPEGRAIPPWPEPPEPAETPEQDEAPEPADAAAPADRQ